jgi:hypothetical protein
MAQKEKEREKEVLLVQVAALYKNLERVENLLTKDLLRVYNQLTIDLNVVQEALSGNDTMAQKHAIDVLESVKQKLQDCEKVLVRPLVSGKFLKLINPRKDDLEKLKTRVEEHSLTQAQLKKAWNDYLDIKQVVERICSQCLVYMGGIAIRTWSLEEQICDLAESLVNQFVNLGASWTSVTIVGEEGLFDRVAQATQIIRLRFPEWDIWSLPFTAYEFGRWMAGEEHEYIEGLRKFYNDEKGRIIRLITTGDDAALIAAEDVTEQEIKDLAPEFDELRKDYQNGKKSAEEVGRIVDQHVEYLKELFVDAFATYFLGPAYLYARACLRLNPIDALQDRPKEPSLARRMGLMLGLLSEMGNPGKKGDAYETGRYKAVDGRLKDLWEKAIEVFHPGYKAEFHFGHPYDRWSKVLYDMLKAAYAENGFTDKDWQSAEKLSKRFLEDNADATDASASLPIILNAAWQYRVLNSDRIGEVEKQALKAMLAVSRKHIAGAQAGSGPPPRAQSISGR